MKFRKRKITIKPDCGNVEYNTSMFNKMNSPTEGPSTNPVSGPFESDIGGEGIGESFINDHEKQKSTDPLTRLNSLESCKGVSKVPYELAIQYKSILNEFPVGTVLKLKIDAGEETYTKTDSEFWKHYRAPWRDTKVMHVFDLARWFAGRKYISRSSIEYGQKELEERQLMEDRITLEYPDLVFLYQGPQRDVDDWDEYEVTQDWSIDVATNDIIDYLCEDCVTDEDVTNWYEMFSTEQTDWVKKHFDELFDKYKQQILDHWEEDAVEDAETNYDPKDYVDWDSMPGGHDYYD